MEEANLNLSTENFLEAKGVLLDVRSPLEYAQGHIPGAVSLPLFDDWERAEIGTLYKQKGKTHAMQRGLEITAPKIEQFFSAIIGHNSLKIYCWRGGMRSQSMGHLFRMTGFKVCILNGGYKSFRRFALKLFEAKRCLKIIGGMTGSGKTDLLKVFIEKGEQVLDLEALANHRGSSFGHIGKGRQPTSEQFQNFIALSLNSSDPSRALWVEDESKMIGTCHIPEAFFAHMQTSPLIIIEKSKEKRLDLLEEMYGNATKEELSFCFRKLGKKLGSQKLSAALAYLDKGDLRAATSLVLDYYDAAYQHAVNKRIPSSTDIRIDHARP